MYFNDHDPAHVHCEGPGIAATFFLNCQAGPVILRTSDGTNAADERALAKFLMDNLEVLCKTWEAIDDQRRRA
jgi:hypothetical protein